MPSTWRPLLLHRKHDGLPPLLVKHEFGPSDYKVWLTDLSYIWTESLDRRQILRRALNVDTSIDPSEDAAQLSLFLHSIADALRQRPGTSVDLDESSDIKKFTMNTSTPLPHPLQPLEWSFVLVLAPQPTFTSEFVLPLLGQELTAKVEKTSLLQQLREKDGVISKLIEKMQGDGVDLGKVFPSAISSKSGAGPTARRVVAKSIKGLREFDQNQWESQVATEKQFSGEVGELVPRIFDDDGNVASQGLQITEYGEWWKRVGRKESRRERAMSPVLTTNAKQESTAEDEFQRQPTPTKSPAHTPRRKGPKTDAEPKISSSLGRRDSDEGGSTTDESDDELQPSHSKLLPLRTDNALASDIANDTKGIQPELMDLDDDGLTASASDLDKSPVKTRPVPKSKQRLGKIGGKRKDSSPETPIIPASKPKLGTIGGKGKLGKLGGTTSNKQEASVSPKQEARDENATPKPVEPEGRGRTAQQPPEPSPPRETSQERANRKREQLKRELESKSQAAIKKKRRF